MPVYTPTFDGQEIFGLSVRMKRSSSERAGQRNTYGGLGGTEYLDMGDRGRFTNVTGRFICSDLDSLNAAQLLFESYHDGNEYELTDQFNNSWPNVILVEFDPADSELEGVFGGGYTQKYRARFEHLVSF